MKHFQRVVAGVIFCTVIRGQSAPANKMDLASVRVLVYDTFGHAAPHATVTLTAVGPQDKFTALGEDVTLSHVPFGLYDLEVHLLGFLPWKGEINVYQRNITLRVGLPLAEPHGTERSELAGQVNGDIRGHERLWVRLIGVYSIVMLESDVDTNGSFQINGAPPGKYLLVLFQKDTALSTRPLEILGGKQAIEVKIPPI